MAWMISTKKTKKQLLDPSKYSDPQAALDFAKWYARMGNCVVYLESDVYFQSYYIDPDGSEATS